MFPYTALLAQRQLDELRAEAAYRRFARTTQVRRPNPIAAAVRRFVDAWSTPLDERPTFLPRLSDYPHRG